MTGWLDDGRECPLYAKSDGKDHLISVAQPKEGMMYESPTMRGYGGAVAHAPQDVRAEFIRKVYHLFFTSLLATVAVGWVCSQPAVLPVMMPLMLPLLIVQIVLSFAVAFVRRSSAGALVLLYIYAAVWGAILGPLLTMIDKFAPGIPMQAGVITVATFGGLSLYVLQTKKDFSYLGGFLFAGVIGLLVAGFVMFFFHSSLMSMVYSVFGILIFCGYVLYDTSQIMNKLAPDEAVFGAVSLYVDFINLFLFILRLLMELNRRD
jgi:protein lifeguard